MDAPAAKSIDRGGIKVHVKHPETHKYIVILTNQIDWHPPPPPDTSLQLALL